MTDLSGIGSNLTFTTGIPPKAPYYYVSAYLDLSGVKLPDAQNPKLTYYFNRDNNLNYLNPLAPAYNGFHIINDNAVIGDVVVYSNPDLVEEGIGALQYEIGGAIFDPEVLDPALVDPVSVLWAGPTGFTPGALGKEDISTGVICYYGHEGGHEPGEILITNEKRYLAITIGPDDRDIVPPFVDENIIEAKNDEPAPLDSLESSRSLNRQKEALNNSIQHGKLIPEHQLLEQIRSQKLKSKKRNARVVVDPDITSGTVYVVVKVYPKVVS